MKKWETPEVLNLELNQTHGSENCDCGLVDSASVASATGKSKKHFCHGVGHDIGANIDKGEGHKRSEDCPEHGNQCCCHSSISSDIPVIPGGGAS